MDPTRTTALLDAARLAPPAGGQLHIHGSDPVLKTPFPAGEAAAVARGLAGCAAARVHELRGGDAQRVEVDVVAAAASLLGFVFQRVPGVDIRRYWAPSTAIYPARAGRHIHLHGGFPHLARGLVGLLGCGDDADSIARAVAARDAFELEDEIAAAGLCAAVVRSPAEWTAHEQGRALAPLAAVSIERIGDAPPEPLPPGSRPLDGVRVLDLTRVLAGPTCGRTLAEHGADVLRVSAPALPSIEPFVIETGRGKRNAFLDLEVESERARLLALARAADVVTQSHRPGSLARRGLGPEALVAERPGLVYVSVDCYGPVGPWAGRAGWEQLAQAASGIAWVQGGATSPALIPAAATDYTTGYLAAYGAATALARRATEGGSWHVHASLSRTALWLLRAGATLDPSAASGVGDVAALQHELDSHWGRLTQLRPALRMERTPPRCDRPPSPLGTHRPEWLPRPFV